MEAAASDPFFLDWGSSVNVNEDLRRTIRNEIEGIESDINSLQSNVKVEEKMSSQLTKDFAHARAELMNLSRGATDDRDNSIMNEQIQMRLRDSLMMEVVSVITPPASPEEKSSSSISSSPPSSSTSPSSDIDPQTSPVPVQKHQGSNDNDNSNERHLGKYLSKCAIEVKELSTMLQKKKANIEEYKTKLSTIQYEIQTIVNQSDRDQKTQKTWSDDVDEKRREFDIEKQRIRCGKEAIQRARKLNGHHAQRLANDVSTQLTETMFKSNNVCLCMI
jgi:peptidoglycan hydrolase CwlO-like protein